MAYTTKILSCALTKTEVLKLEELKKFYEKSNSEIIRIAIALLYEDMLKNKNR
jgi:hypothetical protein